MNLLERLKERVQKTQDELDQERAKDRKEKDRRELVELNERSPYYKRDNGWCDKCHRDYSVLYTKHGNETLAYYLGTCSKGHTVRREITLRDRYYDHSILVRAERDRHSDDLLTPDHPRFKYVYPDKWREYERQREQRALGTV